MTPIYSQGKSNHLIHGLSFGDVSVEISAFSPAGRGTQDSTAYLGFYVTTFFFFFWTVSLHRKKCAFAHGREAPVREDTGKDTH